MGDRGGDFNVVLDRLAIMVKEGRKIHEGALPISQGIIYDSFEVDERRERGWNFRTM